MKHPNIQKITMLILIIGLLALLSGCVQASAAETRPEQLLMLSPTAGEMPEDTYTYPQFTSDELNGNYGGTLYYDTFTEVNIHLEDTTLPLEDAISQGLIYGEELQAMAQVDARNQYCVESNYTENGKTYFYYRYDSYNLEIINDIYETPDRKAYLLRETWIKPPAVHTELTKLEPLDPDQDSFAPNDKEDWGLTFEVLEVSPDGITIQCEQSGGQQFGELTIWSYTLYNSKSDWYYNTNQDTFTQPITMNGTSTIPIDWSDDLSSLTQGSYGIRLRIKDIYSVEDVPPLSRNFYDSQSYDLPFTIE